MSGVAIEWQKGENKEAYLEAKGMAKSAVYHAKKLAGNEKKIQNLEKKEGKIYICKLAKKMKHENQDVISDICVRNDEGKLVTTGEDRFKAWKNHYDHLNTEFCRESESLAEQQPVQGPVSRAINSMKNSKSPGPIEIVVEIIRAAGPLAVTKITKLVNLIIKEGYIPEE